MRNCTKFVFCAVFKWNYCSFGFHVMKNSKYQMPAILAVFLFSVISLSIYLKTKCTVNTNHCVRFNLCPRIVNYYTNMKIFPMKQVIY